MTKIRQYKKVVTLDKCGSKCPNFKHNSGMGHCDDWDSCIAANKEVETWKYDYPEWCPLEVIGKDE